MKNNNGSKFSTTRKLDSDDGCKMKIKSSLLLVFFGGAMD
jgi:hypothetical protein